MERKRLLRQLTHSCIWPTISEERVERIVSLVDSAGMLEPIRRVADQRESILNVSFKSQWNMYKAIKSDNFTTDEINVIFMTSPTVGPLWIHLTLFLPTLRMLGSDEQLEKFLEPALNMEYIGCYAQTELGHGSDVQSLQTLATFNESDGTFTMHSPSIESYKWWVGALGLTATHAVVMARLIIGESDYGVHPFLIQIRDMQTHEPLAGIKMGDIGKKLGQETSDNGYMSFDNVKIPRNSLMSKYFDVSETGEYSIKNPDAMKHIYSGVVFARIGLARGLPIGLGVSLKVAMKYALKRTQFKTYSEDPMKERKLIDYQLQQHKLFTLVSLDYAMIIALKRLLDLDQLNTSKVREGDFSSLKDLHILSSCYKAWFTWMSAHGMEECRKACGGHGFSSFSYLPQVYFYGCPGSTVDGDNVILCLQVGKSVFKAFESKKQLLDLNTADSMEIPSFESSEFIQACLRGIVLAKCKGISENGGDINKLQVESISLSKAFCFYTMYNAFLATLNSLRERNTEEHSLVTMSKVFSKKYILEEISVLLSEGLVPTDVYGKLRESLKEDIRDMRSVALDLTEGIAAEEAIWGSVLSTNNPYERLLESAKNLNPLNKQGAVKPFMHYLRPKL